MTFKLHAKEIKRFNEFTKNKWSFEDVFHGLELVELELYEAILLLEDLRGAKKWLYEDETISEAERNNYELEWYCDEASLNDREREIKEIKNMLKNIHKRHSNYIYKPPKEQRT